MNDKKEPDSGLEEDCSRPGDTQRRGPEKERAALSPRNTEKQPSHIISPLPVGPSH